MKLSLPARGTTRHRWTMVGLVVVALVVACVLVGWRAWSVDRDHSREQAAATAARTSLVRLLSYTPKTVGSDLAAEEQLLTGEFKDSYVSLVTTRIVPKARAQLMTTRAKVVGTAVVSGDRRRMRLLVFVDVTTSGPRLPEPKITGSRLLVTVDRVGSSWLISGLEPM